MQISAWKIALFTVILFFFVNIWPEITSAQEVQPNTYIKIKGSVLDSAGRTAVDYATITLFDQSTKSSLFTTSKKNGSFEFSLKKSKGLYTVSCSRLGYQSSSRNINIDERNREVNLEPILLTIVNKSLSQVTITTRKPLVKQEIDKIIYDVTSDPEARSQNLFELIKKVPLVSISNDDNILLKGESNYKVLLDGKPSLLIVSNPKDIFKTMSAKIVEKIEIITVPPARYEAEGLAGIINIITNKQLRGSNGGVNANYNRLYSLLGGNYAIREEKIGISLLGNMSLEQQPNSPFNNYRLGINSAPLSTYESGYNKYTGKYYWGNTLLSYEFNSLNLLTFNAGINDRNSERIAASNSEILSSIGTVEQAFQTARTISNDENEFEYAFNYQRSFKTKKEALFTTSYKHSNIDIDKNINSDIINLHNYKQPSFRQKNNSGIKEGTLQADFVYPIKKNLFEGGIKVISRRNFSEYSSERLDSSTNSYLLDDKIKNPFDYRQVISGGYSAYYIKLKNLGIKTSVRLEQTHIEALFTTNNTLKHNYLNLIPSISGTYIVNKSTNVGLKFSRRLQRPAIWQLNPFIDRSNPKFLNSGNPDLLPVNFNNLEISVSRFNKGSINTSLTYSFANNTIQNVLLYQQDTVTISTYQNVGTNDNLAWNVNFNYPLSKKVSVNGNGRVSYAWTKGTFSGLEYKNEGSQGHLYMYLTYRVNKNHRVSTNGGFYSPSILLQGKSNAYFYSSINFSKDIFKNKGSISLGINNPFQRYRFAINSFNTPDFIQNDKNRNIYRTFSVNYNQRFGKIKELIKKNKRGISNDDIKRD